MLDAFIIEQLRRREREHEEARPVLELPLPQPPLSDDPSKERERDSRPDKEEGERGVVIIDFGS
ncbi:MAG: hypothetical protein IT381_12320 [Deltaproteobacteria bacterium]|nr:hypothetical protein [Deltaproteobacteria bacterium]